MYLSVSLDSLSTGNTAVCLVLILFNFIRPRLGSSASDQWSELDTDAAVAAICLDLQMASPGLSVDEELAVVEEDVHAGSGLSPSAICSPLPRRAINRRFTLEQTKQLEKYFRFTSESVTAAELVDLVAVTRLTEAQVSASKQRYGTADS